MSFFDEDAPPVTKLPGRTAPDPVEESVYLALEVVGVLVGAWVYRRMGAPKWVAYGLAGLEVRLSRIARELRR